MKLNDKTTTYTETMFTFKGTGFDLISRTGNNQAAIRVNVYAASDRTEAVKTLSVNQKGELELKQIPTVSVQGLPYGEYVVTVGVNKAILNSLYPFLNRGGEFYLDAIRIYDPIDITGTDLTTQEQDALDAYLFHKEAYAHVKEVRNILLTAQDFDALTGSKDGAVFIDVKSFDAQPDGAVENTEIPTETVIDELEDVFPEVNVSGNIALDVLTYNKIGPKNEVYLAPKQAVAFKLQIDSTRVPESLDVGVKIIDVSINYAVSMAQLEGYEDMTLHCALPVYEGNARIGTKTVVLQPVEKGNYYYFTLNGLTAINMNDVIEASLSMTKEEPYEERTLCDIENPAESLFLTTPIGGSPPAHTQLSSYRNGIYYN